MEQLFIAVVFLINGQPMFLDGRGPRPVPSMEVCEERKLMLEEQISLMDFANNIEFQQVVCGTNDEIRSHFVM